MSNHCPSCKKTWCMTLPQSDITVHSDYLIVWGITHCNQCGKQFEINANTTYELKELNRA